MYHPHCIVINSDGPHQYHEFPPLCMVYCSHVYVLEDKMRIFASADPYEFSLSPGQSRYQSTQQSRNTPASSVSGRIPVN